MNMKKGNVLLANEEQLDEVRNCVTRSFNKLRGHMSHEVATKWIGDSQGLDLLLAQMLPPDIREKVFNPTFRVIPRSRGLCIKPTNGKITISSSTDVFNGRIDPAFTRGEFHIIESSKGETPIEFLKMLRTESFAKILNEYREGQIDSLVFTQDQVVSAVRSARIGGLFLMNDFFFLASDRFSVVHVHSEIENADLLSVELLGIDSFVNLNSKACQCLFVVPIL